MARIWTEDPCVDTYPGGYWIVGGRRSGTMKEAELTIFGTDKTMRLPIRTCTEVWEVKESICKKLDRLPDSVSFVVKRGCTYAKLQDSDQMMAKVMVRGITSWERERMVYEHPVAIIGAGHNGLRQALEFIKVKLEDFVVFERWDRVGGDAWVKQANATSKLQTELGTYHLQFDESFPVPKGLPTYPCRDDILKHFEDVSREYGILPHVRLNTRVDSMDKPSRGALSRPDRSYTLCASDQHPDTFKTVEELEMAGIGGFDAEEETVEFTASAVFMFPGNLTLAKKEEYKGEDAFGGQIGYGMFDEFDYDKVKGKDVAIVGMGAFSVENLRTCLEKGAGKCTLVVRRKNLVMPRVMSWYINQALMPVAASELISSIEGPYALAGDDPWEYYAVSKSQDRKNVRISQRARFPISDLYFLACYYNRAEVRLDSVKRLTPGKVNLESGDHVQAEALIKVFGFYGSTAVDRLMHAEEMLGYWVNGDNRRWVYSESPGVDFSRIAGTSLSPAAIFGCAVSTHFLLYPKDFREVSQSKAMPRMKREAGSSRPCYVLTARNATAVSMTLTQLCPFLLERKDFNLVAHEKQLACHPLEDFLQELQAEWDNYCELLRPAGSTDPAPEYPYTVQEIQSMMAAEMKAALQMVPA